ncbi:MAG: four helix bundle protein [Abitibacteriaceae bacterium]|nr:four helix bundle protein [Abditibacteriaceae bacterium]
MNSRSYRDLEVWQKGMDVVVECYRATRNFPETEIYGLTSQLQRAAVSVPANIAEGQGRQHTAEFIQHLSIAYGSLAELETHIEIAQRLAYISSEDAQNILAQTSTVGRLLNGLLRSLRNSQLSSNGPRPPITDHRLPTTDYRS